MLDDAPTGTPGTRLIVIRGNSGSGKSTIAPRLQRRHGGGCAVVDQDHLRRKVVRERDRPGAIAPALIAQTVRFALDHQYHVVLEGILFADRYAGMIRALCRAHCGTTRLFYLDVSLDETLRRHTTRPQAAEFTPENMRSWYSERDLLGFGDEHVIGEASGLEASIALIAAIAGLPLTGRTEDFLPTTVR
jgi:adenylate kinase family enzyme